MHLVALCLRLLKGRNKNKMYCAGCYRRDGSTDLVLLVLNSLSSCSVLPVSLLKRPLVCPAGEIRKWKGQVYYCR